MTTPDFFRAGLDGMIDLNHPLAILRNRFSWAEIEAVLSIYFARKDREDKLIASDDLFCSSLQIAGVSTSQAGRPRLSIRLMASLILLKHTFNESDESVVERWAQDVDF